MGVMCEITVYKSNKVYRPGEIVSGRVRYAVDEPTKYKEIVLSFQGKGKCSWTETTGTGDSKTSKSYSGLEDIFVQEINLLKAAEEITTIPVGSYEHSFQFVLPDNIPSSHKDHTGSISYFIEMKFKRPKYFSSTKTFTTEVIVSGYVKQYGTEGPIVCGLQKSVFSLLSKENFINLKAEIAKTILNAGEEIKIKYTVVNNTKVTIPSVVTELFCRMTYTASCGEIKQRYAQVENCKAKSPTIYPNSKSDFNNSIRTLPELYTIQNCKVVMKEYVIRITLRLPAPHINNIVEMPVVIGEKASVEDIAYVLEDSERYDPPPTYWEAMKEEEDEK